MNADTFVFFVIPGVFFFIVFIALACFAIGFMNKSIASRKAKETEAARVTRVVGYEREVKDLLADLTVAISLGKVIVPEAMQGRIESAYDKSPKEIS